MRFTYTLACLFLVFSLTLQTSKAQTDILPAERQESPTLLVGAMAHLGTGEVIEDAAVGFADGKITIVAPASEITDTASYNVVDVAGMHLYPGFILPNTSLGLNEVSSVAATVDQSETGSYNPNVRSLVAYNTDSELIPTLRYNGILLAQTTPTGGVVSGSSSVVKLDGWNWEDAAYAADDAVHINWPLRLLSPQSWLGETSFRENDSYDSTVDELDKLFDDAAAYKSAPDPARRNLKLESLVGLFDGSKALHIHANNAQSIIEGASFAESHGITKIVIVGGAQALLVAGLLVEKNIPVVLANVHRTPTFDHEDTVLPYKLPAALANAGVKVALGYSGTMNSRNLPFFVGTAIAHGADPEEALKMVTANTAEILGIGERTGTIQVGKDANILVSRGDVFDMRTNDLAHAFILGSEIQLEGRQQMLYKKYSTKYGHGR